MRLTDRQFDLTAFAVLAALAPHLARLPPWLGLPLLAIAIARPLLRRRDPHPVPTLLRLPLAGLLLALVIVHYGNVFGREPGTALGCGLLALKLLEAEHTRDARVTIGFAAFVLMSALLFDQALIVTLGLCLTLVLLLAALAALEPAPADARRPLRSGLKLGAALLVAGLPLAIAAFLFVPRLGSPLWGAPGADSAARTGLDERMAPGSLTDLLIDDSAAFRVRFDAGVPPPSERRYFRALVLWDFDGAAWTRGAYFARPRNETVQARGAPLDYTVTLEPTDRRWLVALDLPISTPADAHLSADHVLVARERIDKPREYRVQSATNYVLAPTLDPLDRARALALPAGFDPQARVLARGWRAEGKDDAAVIGAALAMFRASFTYTLAPPLLGRDSVDDFLFDTKQGFCEHYSSAFTFLMRAAGIPARVVTGYQGGWWNALGGYLLVRQSDAHAWSEVWLAGRGWVRVDPTAAVSPVRVELGAAAANGSQAWYQSDWMRGLRNRLDLANRMWTDAIVGFNALRQKSVLAPFGIPEASQHDLMAAMIAALVLLLALATVWALSARARAPGDELDRAWTRLCQRLARTGVVRGMGEGPLDFLARLRDDLPGGAASVAELVQHYVSLRYGVVRPEPERVHAFTRAVRHFRPGRAVVQSVRDHATDRTSTPS